MRSVIKETTLTDNSSVFDVIIEIDNHKKPVILECESEATAKLLQDVLLQVDAAYLEDIPAL